MLLKRIILLLFLIFGIIILNVLYNRSSQDHIVDYKEVAPYIHTINSLDINDNDFSDLVFLDTIIGNKHIVFLGEQTHSDGTTFQAKSRLIRYLHEKHKFNVILYEAGLYDMWLMNRTAHLQSNEEAQFDPGMGLYSFWWDNEDCLPLWKYYNKTLQSNRPIILGGFDLQLTGHYYSREDRAKDIKEILSRKQIHLAEYPSFNSAIEQLSLTYLWEYKRFPQAKFDSIQTDLNKILALLQNPTTEKENIYYRYIKGIRDYGQLMWDYNPGDIPRMNVRDSLMAENLMWQIDSLYTNQKVIVWLANLHLFKVPLTNDGVTFIPLGKYIKDKYSDSSYLMAFTSYALTNPNSKGIHSEAGINALEYMLHSKKYKYVYLHMNEINADSFLKKEYFSVINQRMNEKREWNSLIDGLFYIDLVSTINKED